MFNERIVLLMLLGVVLLIMGIVEEMMGDVFIVLWVRGLWVVFKFFKLVEVLLM